MRKEIDWSRPHLITVAIGAVCGVLLLVPSRELYFGIFPNANVQSGIAFLFYSSLVWLHRSTLKAIDTFEPETILEAKRANEQIKLTATICNNLSAASIGYAIIAKYFGVGGISDGIYLALAVVVALQLHACGKAYLACLKDDAERKAPGSAP